jgi:hypothetical protein
MIDVVKKKDGILEKNIPPLYNIVSIHAPAEGAAFFTLIPFPRNYKAAAPRAGPQKGPCLPLVQKFLGSSEILHYVSARFPGFSTRLSVTLDKHRYKSYYSYRLIYIG